MRVLEAISGGLALTAAAIICAVLRGSADTQLLSLSLLCCLSIAVYQIVNFYLGITLQKRNEQSRRKEEALPNSGVEALGSGESTTFVTPPSIVENTTRHLEALPHNVKRQNKRV